MIRNLKALGLVAVAALAMSAMFASAAQAQNGTFTAGATPSTHTSTLIRGSQYGGENKNFFQAGESKVHCTDEFVKFTGSDPDGTANSISITPHYAHCKVGNLPVTVTMNGCTYNFDRPATIAGTKNYTGTVDLICPKGVAGVEIHVYLSGTYTDHAFNICTDIVTPFNNKGHVVYTPAINEATKKDDLTLDVHVTGIPYHQSGSCGTASGEATYLSNVTVTAESLTGVPHDLWISH